MRLSRLLESADRAFFQPRDPLALGCVRAVVGVLAFLQLALLMPDVRVWFGDGGLVPRSVSRGFIGNRFNPLLDSTLGDGWLAPLLGLLIVASLMMAAGVFSRISTAVVALGLVALHHRNAFILNSGDSALRIACILLALSPSGAAFSWDHLRRQRALGQGPSPAAARPIWAFQLLRVQVAIVYLSTALWKAKGEAWLDGTAVYYTARLYEFHRFPVPWVFESMTLVHALTWATLVVEGSVGVFVWFRETRYIVLAAAAGLHIGLEYSMNVPLFQPTMLGLLVCFVPPEDLRSFRTWFRSRVLRAPLPLAKPGASDPVKDA